MKGHRYSVVNNWPLASTIFCTRLSSCLLHWLVYTHCSPSLPPPCFAHKLHRSVLLTISCSRYVSVCLPCYRFCLKNPFSLYRSNSCFTYISLVYSQKKKYWSLNNRKAAILRVARFFYGIARTIRSQSFPSNFIDLWSIGRQSMPPKPVCRVTCVIWLVREPRLSISALTPHLHKRNTDRNANQGGRLLVAVFLV